MSMDGGDILKRFCELRSMAVCCWPENGVGTSTEAVTQMLGLAARSPETFAAALDPASGRAFSDNFAERRDFRMEVRTASSTALDASVVFDQSRREAYCVLGTIDEAFTDLAAREELIRAMAENSPAMLWMGDAQGKCMFLNKALRTFWGVDPEDLSTFDWGSTTHPDDLKKLAVPFTKAMAEQTSFKVEARYRRADGEYRTMRTEASPRFDPASGVFLGMTGVNTDITARLVAEERTRMLMGELNHRTKNILAVAQAVARQTARHSPHDEFIQTFNDRLVGLAASNDLLLRRDWTGADMAELVEAQLSHLGDVVAQRIHTSGPSLSISSTAAQTLGMALHELSTNSLKYGALSRPNGHVQLDWSLGDQDRPFEIRWIEHGVPDVQAPTRKGFGHSVIVDMVSSAMDAEVSVEFGESGFRWTVSARSRAALQG
jgi:PAS domain S-box-containing protein